jgi:hypothetical protein
MAIVKINTANTFNQWRIGTNELGSQLGDVSGTVANNATTTFTGQKGVNASDFVGTAATFTVTNTAGTYSVAITQAGAGYATSDTVVIKGSDIGGVDTTNDATITITGQTGGNIDTATIAGTAAPALAAEFRLVQDFVEPTQALTTTAATLADAINEHDAELGTITAGAMGTTAATVSGAILELETEIDTLNTRVEPTQAFNSDFTATTIMDGINELMTDLGNVTAANMKTTATTGVTAINELSLEIGGTGQSRMAANYDGADTNIISALNNLFAASSVSTLNAEFLRRDGIGDMTGMMTLDNLGISSGSDSMLIKTGASDVTRMTIRASDGNIGIGKVPAASKVDVSGTVKATAFNENGTTLTNKYVAKAGTNTVTAANTFTGSNTFTAGQTLIIGATTVQSASLDFPEFLQDLSGAMFTGNAETGGISAVYNDGTGKITLAIANNAHSHIASNVTDFTSAAKTAAGAMWAGNSESGVAVTYQAGDQTLDINVNDPTISLTGPVTGSATMTNLGNVSIATTLAADPTITLTGAVTGTATMTNLGNVSIATTPTSDPTITLAGDATGSATLTNLGNATLTVAIVDDSHNHTTANIDNFTENVQDIVGTMVNPTNTESGINVTYNDGTGKLNFDVSDPTITLTGAVTGSGTITNLGAVSIATSQGSISTTPGNSTITSAMIVNGTVTGTDIADGTIETSELAAMAVTGAKMYLTSVLVIKNSAGTTIKTIYGAGG